MSASNGGVRREGDTFFTKVQQPFPDFVDGGKIDTVQFLESAKGVVALVEMFGKVFAPVKYDMSGNIDKLTQQYSKNVEKHKTIHDMIISEKNEGGNFAIDSLLWLKRGLHFFQVFLQCMLQDAEEGKSTDSLAPSIKKAYKTTLEKYHGWMAQQLFNMLSRMCPGRKELMLAMALGREGQDATVLRDMVPFLKGLSQNVSAIDALYKEQGLNLEVKA